MTNGIDDANILHLDGSFKCGKFNNSNSCDGDIDDLPLLTDVPSYEEFYSNFLCRNRPCILPCDLVKAGGFDKSWFNGGLDVDYLGNKYGKLEVPVYDCSQSYFDSHQQTTRTLNEYLAYLASPQTAGILYAKDWHLYRQHRSAYPAEPPLYRTPALFCSDWLNEYLEDSSVEDEERACLGDDYRFVYLGGTGTWTGLHSDVFNSFSWSVNMNGHKLWLLLPPGQERLLRRSGHLPVDLRQELCMRSDDGAVNGALRQCRSTGAQYMVVGQKSGQAMFVPSGWHHQVWNTSGEGGGSDHHHHHTLSVNHNWLNGANAARVWRHLHVEMCRVMDELADVRPTVAERGGAEAAWTEWRRQCETVLRALAGMNIGDWFSLLLTTARKRVDAVRLQRPLVALDGRCYSNGHVTCDLRQLIALFTEMVDTDPVCSDTLTERVTAQIDIVQQTLDQLERYRDD